MQNRDFRFREKIALFFRKNPVALFAFLGVSALFLTDNFPLSSLFLLGLLLIVLLIGLFCRNRFLFGCVVFFLFAVLHQRAYEHFLSFPLTEMRKQGEVSVRVCGDIDDLPQQTKSGKYSKCTLKLQWIEYQGERFITSHSIFVYVAPPSLRYGDQVILSGTLVFPKKARNPGQFDEFNYFYRKKIQALLYAQSPDSVEKVRGGWGNPLKKAAFFSRTWVEKTLTQGLEDFPEQRALIKGMVLGMRDAEVKEIEDSFRYSGALHLFAVSGLHVGIFALVLWTLLKLLRVRRAYSVGIIILCLFFYAFITGLRPSAVRAAIMAALFLGGFLFNRKPQLINSLSLAALLILAVDTQQLFLPGFQLSFFVLLTIVLLTTSLQKPFRSWVSPDPFLPTALLTQNQRNYFHWLQRVRDVLCVSASAWVGSLPLIWWHFNLVTPIAIVTNSILVGFAFFIILFAVLSILFQWAHLTFLSFSLNMVNALVAKVILVIASFFSTIPGGHFYMPTSFSPSCEICVLDLPNGGGAQCIHVKGAGSWMIDCGSFSDYDNILSPYLREKGLEDLEELWISHGDQRHMGAAEKLIEEYEPKVLAISIQAAGKIKKLVSQGKGNQIMERIVSSGDKLFLGDSSVEMHVLYPPLEERYSRSDDRCLVVQLIYADWRILFMSDSGFVTEKWLIDSGIALQSDVLIMGRHASDYCGLNEFIDVVNPQAIVATHASFPSSERIPQKWKKKIEEKQISFFDQLSTGAVTIELTERKLKIESFLDNQVFVKKAL